MHDEADETDTMYNNNSREQLFVDSKMALNVDLIEVSRDISGRKNMQYNVATVNDMNATWH